MWLLQDTNHENNNVTRRKIKSEAVNFTNRVVFEKTFIEKVKTDKYYSQKFIAYYDAKSHIEKLEENMTNLHDMKTQVTIGDSVTLTLTKKLYWFSYQKYDKISKW